MCVRMSHLVRILRAEFNWNIAVKPATYVTACLPWTCGLIEQREKLGGKEFCMCDG